MSFMVGYYIIFIIATIVIDYIFPTYDKILKNKVLKNLIAMFNKTRFGQNEKGWKSTINSRVPKNTGCMWAR